LQAQDLLKSEYSYRRYTTQDGLPSNACNDVCQDSRGFIWIASSYGLSRFDGFSFKTFLKGKFANLFFLKENPKGEMEAVTNNVLYTVDNKRDTIRATILSDNYYITLNSRFLPTGYGVFYSSGESKSQQHFFKINENGIEKLIENEHINDFYVDTYFNFYYDRAKEHLYIPYEDGVKVVAKTGLVSVHQNIAAYRFIKYGDALWAVCTDGLYKQENGKFRQIVAKKMKVTGLLCVGADNSLLFGDIQNIYRLKKNGAVEKIFSAQQIDNFIVDSEGNLWVATNNGLYNLFRLQFKNYVPTDKNDAFGSAIYYPENKTVIAGTGKGNLFEISENALRQIRYPQKYSADKVSFLSFVGVNQNALINNELYMPAGVDILKIKGKTAQWLGRTAEREWEIFNVLAKPDGNLLAGTQTSILEITTEGKLKRKHFGVPFFKQAMFSNICFDAQGKILYGGYYGLGILGNDSVEKTIFGDKFMLCMIIRSDNDSNSWFVSENRLYKIENNEAVLKTTINDIILNLCFTKNNRVVIVAVSGIYIFDKELRNSVFYNHENGFTGAEALKSPLAEDGDGNLFLPCNVAMVRFNPDELLTKTAPPRLHLISLAVSENNVLWNNAEEYKFNHKQKNFRFSFIGLSYSATQNVRYHYRLVGFQNEWGEPTNNREVTFNNLKSGSYRFEIYADAGTDSSHSEILSYYFTIKPAFWQTTWFLTLCVAFLMLLSANAAFYFVNRKNKILIESLNTERQFNELKINSIRLKAIPHFNANVLAAIEYYIMNKSKDEAISLLGLYSQFTFKTLQEVDKSSRSLNVEIEYVKMYLDLERLRFGDKFEYAVEIDKNVDLSVHLPNMMLHTWAENAVKHGFASLQSGGFLTIKAGQSGDFVVVSVADNGAGRQTAAANKNVRSTKQGLSILEKQIEIYNRFNKEKIKLSVEDLEQGTRFSIEVPIRFRYEIV
jgi:uncharacterized protein YhbP (UPF0306 family)